MPLYLVRHCQVAARAFSQPSQLQASSKAELLQASFLLILHLSCLFLFLTIHATHHGTCFSGKISFSEYFLNKYLSLQSRAETMS